MVTGTSPSPDCDRVIGNLHFQWAELQTNVWVSYVASDTNLSDEPSRRSLDLPDRDEILEGLGGCRFFFALPGPAGPSLEGPVVGQATEPTHCGDPDLALRSAAARGRPGGR